MSLLILIAGWVAVGLRVLSTLLLLLFMAAVPREAAENRGHILAMFVLLLATELYLRHQLAQLV